MAESDDFWRRMKLECEAEHNRFTAYTDQLPKEVRQRLWGYPGAQYFLHHRMLALICENMIFSDEKE